MPTAGTTRHSFRFTPEFLAELDALRASLGGLSRSAALRLAVRELATARARAEKKSGKNGKGA
jgi:metal-responsive CopG/Arc/MetJ family transcriptional regulator